MDKPADPVQTKKLIFATNNPHKVKEMQAAVGRQLKIISLKAAGIERDIPEPHNSLEKNALEKSRTIYLLCNGHDCFSEDTGLEVRALNGEPGVKSARYAGEPVSFSKNIDKLLGRLKNISRREARFRTVISLIFNDCEYYFEGICEGKILRERQGSKGFGYDAVFMPDGATKSFAQMDIKEKNLYSHRKRAADKMILFLKSELFISDPSWPE